MTDVKIRCDDCKFVEDCVDYGWEGCRKFTPKLKRCPFCGGDKVATIPCESGFYVVCYDILHDTGEGCGSSSGWHETEQKAIEAWNKRVSEVAK